MSASYEVFGDPDLLKPPTKRAVHSDRMALLMAEMAKLAYLPFDDPEESSDGVGPQRIDEVVAAIRASGDASEARRILLDFAVDESPASDQPATTQLSETLAKGGFKLVKTYSVGGTQAFLVVRENTENSGREQTGITVLSFRGTDQKVADWKTNLTAYKQIVDGVPIHSGFWWRFVWSGLRSLTT